MMHRNLRNLGVVLCMAIGIATLAAGAASAARAEDGEHTFGAEFGQVLLMGDFGERFSDSLGLRLHYSYDTSDMFGLLVHFMYSSHPGPADDDLSIMGLVPNLKINMAYFDKLVLYSFAGFGPYRIVEEEDAARGSAISLGLNAGVGFNLDLAKSFKFGASVSFHNVFNKTDRDATTASEPSGMDIGGTFTGLFMNVSYVF